MEQNQVVEAIKAALAVDRPTPGTAESSNYNITINGNVSITVQHPPSTPSPQARINKATA